MLVPRRFVGTVHLFQGPAKSNPMSLYAHKEGEAYVVSPVVDPWNTVIGKGATINKAAGDFEIKWKAQPIPAEQYTGPHWEEGIKAEKPPAPPKPAAPPPAASAPASASGAPPTGPSTVPAPDAESASPPA
ncbi:MAG: hypothetical protein HY207_08385 [Nitrospirae bacterium]|nr:hypothetical protein [Nitrospirota bacterium]